MKKARVVGPAAVLFVLAALLAAMPANAHRGPSGVTRGIPLHIRKVGQRGPLVASPMASPLTGGGGETLGSVRAELPYVNRAAGPPDDAGAPAHASGTPTASNLPVSMRHPEVLRSWEGLNHFDSRFSDGGNQFSVEPPDQGLCSGRGKVMETVNDVTQVYSSTGKALIPGNSGIPGSGPVGLSTNQFFKLPTAFDRTTNTFGPFMGDVTCYYDQATQRWFHMSLDLGVDPKTANFTGASSLALAVSKTANPLGGWYLYNINTANDGTDGMPDHHCAGGPCFGDYPKIGADANGIYITTNEFDFFGNGFHGVQLYALSKAGLESGSATPVGEYFQSLTIPSLHQKAFTVLAASSRPGSFVSARNGTEYLLSSTNGNKSGRSTQIAVWALTNTGSLDRSVADLGLRHTIASSLPYAPPPYALQKDGPTPMLRCANQGVKCIGDPAPFHQKGPIPLASNDDRMMASFQQGGVLWGTIDTAIKGAGGSKFTHKNNFGPAPIGRKAGVLYVAIRPTWTGGFGADVAQQGYVTAADANLVFPSIVMGTNGTGFIGSTLVGPQINPSAAYARIGWGSQPSVIRVAAAGKGPDDGFSGTFEGEFGPRWGDYGYAIPGAKGTVWFAAEYIAQRCSFATWEADTTCGNTRSFLANWSTRVTQLKT